MRNSKRPEIRRILFSVSTDLAQPFIDTHVHFWDRGVDGLKWAWLEPGFTHPRLGRLPEIATDHFTADELRRDAGGRAPTKVVHIQAAQAADPAVETGWLQQMSETTGWPDVAIGYTNLAATDAAEIVRRHQQFPIFRGVRDLPAGEHLDDPDVIRGFHAVAELGVPIEVMTSWPNFGHVRRLALAHPDVTVILGHAGLPVARDPDYFAHWRSAMQQIAEVPNLVCKISALASGADPQWSVPSITPWFLGCVDAFGADRCMIGTNWPIDSLFGDYPRLVDAYREIASARSAAEQADLFVNTAALVYRL
jgi:predicted TIM-barrel fold metal-dependent hydrolase